MQTTDEKERLDRITLPVTGMTCAACVRRGERGPGKGPGGRGAAGNPGHREAWVRETAGAVGARGVGRAVEGVGVREEESSMGGSRECGRLRAAFLLAAALAALILLGSLPTMCALMPPIPMGWLNLGLLILPTPVQFWAGRRFYRGAWGALRHRQADMNTLVVMGTSAAYLYSAVAALAPGLFAAGRADVYFDTSALIIDRKSVV